MSETKDECLEEFQAKAKKLGEVEYRYTYPQRTSRKAFPGVKDCDGGCNGERASRRHHKHGENITVLH
jgi:hypothetical protein